MTEHLIGEGESLAAVAESHGLSGWQALYYAELNGPFRYQYPDPWDIPVGARILVPTTPAEQHATLLSRIRRLEALLGDAQAIGVQQRQLLGSDVARAALNDPQRQLGPLVRDLSAGILNASQVLRAPESTGNRGSLALTEDALRRWALASRAECATLLSLLTQSARGVAWMVPSVTARGWCDAGCPHFWAKPLLAAVAGWHSAEGVSPEILPLLVRAHEVALAAVLQQLITLRTTAMMELNRLDRRNEGLDS